jgi:transposase
MKKYIVRLAQAQRQELQHLVSTGTESARLLLHARILLKADAGEHGPAWTDEQISEAVEVSTSTLVRVRRVFAEQGLHAALNRRSLSRTRPCRLDGEQEAHLIALACSAPPDGRDHWSLRLLASRLVTLELVEEVSHETVRHVLKKTNSSRGKSGSGASHQKPMPNVSARWRTRWTCTRDPLILSVRSSAWTR